MLKKKIGSAVPTYRYLSGSSETSCFFAYLGAMSKPHYNL
jgi:hypothetical protein